MPTILSRLAGLWLLPCLFTACAKRTTLPGTASLTIINALPGAGTLVPNFSGTQSISYKQPAMLEYGSYSQNLCYFNAYSGTQPLGVYRIVDTTNKGTPLYDLVLDLPRGSMHTLFLTGSMTTPDTVFTADDLRYFPASDSAMSIRFIHLSQGTAGIKVSLAGNTNEIATLAYKKNSGFRTYAVKRSQADYVFEFRDAGTGQLIAQYTTGGISNLGTGAPNAWLYRNFTLALVGKPGATGIDAPAVYLIPH